MARLDSAIKLPSEKLSNRTLYYKLCLVQGLGHKKIILEWR